MMSQSPTGSVEITSYIFVIAKSVPSGMNLGGATLSSTANVTGPVSLKVLALAGGRASCRAALKSRTGALVFSTLSSNLIQLSWPLNRGLVYLNRGQTD